MNENPVFKQIEHEIGANDVVLFMKGTPVFPQCGFSAAVVQVLNHLDVTFKGKTRVQQHQMVYAALKGRMGNELHALALQTAAE